MTNQQDDDLAAFVVSETELAALVPTRDDLERWLAECAHRARLMELADERGMVGRRRAKFMRHVPPLPCG